jgi:sigma-E factor negative regulatory protein RseA
MVPREFDAMTEELSAWMDGELGSKNARGLPLRLRDDVELRCEWDCYHLVGDVLRGMQGPDLRARIHVRLEAEPTAFAPSWRRATRKLDRHALSVAAGIAVAAFVGWMFVPGVLQDSPAIIAIPAAEVAQATRPAGDVINDYLLAHQRYSPSYAMQGIAPYVVTVADDQGGDFSN